MNKDTDVGLKRLQSWYLIVVLLALLGALCTTLLSGIWSLSDSISCCLNYFNCGLRAPKSKLSPTSPGSQLMEKSEKERNAADDRATTPTKIGAGQIQHEGVLKGLKRSDLQAEEGVSPEICISPSHLSLPGETGNGISEPEMHPPTSEVTTKLVISGKSYSGYSVLTNLVKNPWRLASSVSSLDHSTLKVIPILNLACLVWSIIAIELTITWNNIGVVGFLKLLRDISVEKTELLIYNTVLNALLDFDVVNVPEIASLEVEDLIASREEDNGQQNSTEGNDPHSPVKGATRSVWGTTIYMLLNLREEIHGARSTPMLQRSIGDKIISILENDANNTEVSVQKMDVTLALKILDGLKRAQGQPINPAEPASQVQSMKKKFWEDFTMLILIPMHLLCAG